MEHSELFEKKFSILKEISNAMVVTDSINAMADLMLDLAINYTNAEKGSFMLINEQNELYIHTARGIDIKLAKTYRTKIGKGIAGTVAKNRLPVLVEDIETDKRFKKRDRYKTRSFISCPVLSKNKLLGVLNINDKKDNTPFTKDEFILLQTIANQAAIILENAFLMNQLKVKAAEVENINRKLIETDLIKTEFLTRVSHELRTPLNSIKGSIYYLQQTEKQSSGELKEFYDIISNETSALIFSVENLLNFLRIEDEAKLIKKSLINLSSVLQEVVTLKFLSTTLKKRSLKLDINVKDSNLDIAGDKIKVIQFFINLIEGISHYLEKDDTIRIVAKENDFIQLNIILPRSLPDVAQSLLINSRDVFFTEYPEHKLKLYLARKIAEVHGWYMNTETIDNSFLISIIIPRSAEHKIEAVVNMTMELFVDLISELLGLNTCSVMLSDKLTGDLTIRSARGLYDEVPKLTRIKVGESIAGWVALEGKPLLVEDIERDPRFGMKNIPQYNTKSLLSLPLKIGDKVIGVLNLNNKKSAEPFNMRDLQKASVVSERILYFIEKLYSGEYKNDEYKQFLTSLENLLNAEKKYHKKNAIFSDLMLRIMDRFGAGEEDKRLALYVSMTYDLGLVLIDESILNKKKLLPAEINSIKVHPHMGVSLLSYFEFSDDVKRAILHHHERYDGNGYPDRLKGKEIPFLSRVLSVVDSFCSLISERHYRKAFTVDEAIKEIKSGSGTAYDPKVVEALEDILIKDKYFETD